MHTALAGPPAAELVVGDRISVLYRGDKIAPKAADRDDEREGWYHATVTRVVSAGVFDVEFYDGECVWDLRLAGTVYEPLQPGSPITRPRLRSDEGLRVLFTMKNAAVKVPEAMGLPQNGEVLMDLVQRAYEEKRYNAVYCRLVGGNNKCRENRGQEYLSDAGNWVIRLKLGFDGTNVMRERLVRDMELALGAGPDGDITQQLTAMSSVGRGLLTLLRRLLSGRDAHDWLSLFMAEAPVKFPALKVLAQAGKYSWFHMSRMFCGCLSVQYEDIELPVVVPKTKFIRSSDPVSQRHDYLEVVLQARYPSGAVTPMYVAGLLRWDIGAFIYALCMAINVPKLEVPVEGEEGEEGRGFVLDPHVASLVEAGLATGGDEAVEGILDFIRSAFPEFSEVSPDAVLLCPCTQKAISLWLGDDSQYEAPRHTADEAAVGMGQLELVAGQATQGGVAGAGSGSGGVVVVSGASGEGSGGQFPGVPPPTEV
jgi:hypothetical protein